MHTTKLTGNWIAIHDGTPSPESLVRFVKLHNNGEPKSDGFEIPYGVIFEFIANQVRDEKIARLEQADANEIFCL